MNYRIARQTCVCGLCRTFGKEISHRMKKHKRKGFTLLELIIVIGLFSVIMYSVLQLMGPVSKYFVRSSNFETTNACIDNMKRAIEGNLKYADRVRIYSGFKPYDYPDSFPKTSKSSTSGQMETMDYKPTDTLTEHVQAFYDEFFLNRDFLASSGNIYVLVFDNETLVRDDDLNTTITNPPAVGTVTEFSENYLNSGKIVQYVYEFDNPGGQTTPKLISPKPNGGVYDNVWYVNQKLYGSFEYRFQLGAFDAASVSSFTFDPSDFTIRISLTEVKAGGNGLYREPNSSVIDSTFSMKNVLNSSKAYAAPLADYITRRNPTATGILDRYVTDDTHPVFRYKEITTIDPSKPDDEKFDGFYFIYTLPDTIYDDPDEEYIAEVSKAMS